MKCRIDCSRQQCMSWPCSNVIILVAQYVDTNTAPWPCALWTWCPSFGKSCEPLQKVLQPSKNKTTFPKFPHCEITLPYHNFCCQGCFVMCKCGKQMARKHGKLLDVCEWKVGDISVCRTPGLPDREETLMDMTNSNCKLAELTQAAQVKASNWHRMITKWNSNQR